MKQKTDVLQGTLALMVLKTLDVLGSLHGYGIARRIEQISGDLLAVNQGTLYPVLLKLEQEGAIASEWGASENNRRARFYRLTREGRKQLQAETQDWEQTAAIIGAVLRSEGGGFVMKYLRRFFKRVANLATRRAQDERLREEIEEHIALQTAENIRAGLSPVEARRQAMLKFGGVEAVKEDYRAQRGLLFMENLVQDLRFALRSLRRTPGLTAFVVITLALGIGMTSATFSMVDALIFRPYPVPHPGGVVTLVSTTHDSVIEDFSYREYLDIRDKTKSYDGVIANADMEAVGFSAEPGSDAAHQGRDDGFRELFRRARGASRSWGAGFVRTKTRCPAVMRWWCWGRTSGGTNSRATLPSWAGRFA